MHDSVRTEVTYSGEYLSPLDEIRRFHLEIGHSCESCRSVKKKNGEGGSPRSSYL